MDMNLKTKLKIAILKEIRETTGRDYAEACKPAIDEYIEYMAENDFPSYLSEEEMYGCLKKYIAVPPQVIFITKDGKIFHKKAKHNQNHVVAVRKFVRDYLRQCPESSLGNIDLEQVDLFDLMRLVQKEQIEMYYIWLDWIDCNTYCNIWRGAGEAPKRDMVSRMISEEFLQTNQAFHIEDDTYMIEGIPKENIDLIVR